MTLEAIKEAIGQLPADVRTQLAEWLLQEDMREWDRQIEEDFSAGGSGMTLLKEAEADVREGRVRPMDEFLSEIVTKRKPESQR
jgi:hypothetical protein